MKNSHCSGIRNNDMLEVTQNAFIPQWKVDTQTSQKGILGQNSAQAIATYCMD